MKEVGLNEMVMLIIMTGMDIITIMLKTEFLLVPGKISVHR